MQGRMIDPNDRPLGITDSIKLLTDIIILSKYFLKKPLRDISEPSDYADKLYCHVLNLEQDLKDQKEVKKKEECAQKFLTMAKGDLFSEKLTNEDEDILKKLSLQNLKSGEYVLNFLGKKDIDDYIDRYTKEKYHTALKQLVDRACHLCILGFASYNLLMERRQYDKDLSVSSPYDAKDILSSEKNKIVNLVATLAKSKTSSTKAGLITTIQIEIISDIEHLREKFQSIEMALLKKKNDELENQLALFFKSLEEKPAETHKEIKLLQQIFMEKKIFEQRINSIEKRFELINQNHAAEIKSLSEKHQNEKTILENKINEQKALANPDVEYQKKMKIVAIIAVTGFLLSAFGIGAALGIPMLIAATVMTVGLFGVGAAGLFGYAIHADHHKKPFFPVSFFNQQTTIPYDDESRLDLSLINGLIKRA